MIVWNLYHCENKTHNNNYYSLPESQSYSSAFSKVLQEILPQLQDSHLLLYLFKEKITINTFFVRYFLFLKM